MYNVRLTDTALKSLKKMDRQTSRLIMAWIRKNLEGTENPRQHGKALQANMRNKWRYRIGSYRAIADIVEDEVIILVLKIGHRSEVYK